LSGYTIIQVDAGRFLDSITWWVRLLGFVCELSFGGERKGRKGLRRGKPLFESFKKIGKGFGGF